VRDEGCYVKPVLVHVCREIPHGYFISELEKIPCLHWRPDPVVRQLRPEPDPGLVFKIRLLKTEPYDLNSSVDLSSRKRRARITCTLG
jgi:hypothetical protein